MYFSLTGSDLSDRLRKIGLGKPNQEGLSYEIYNRRACVRAYFRCAYGSGADWSYRDRGYHIRHASCRNLGSAEDGRRTDHEGKKLKVGQRFQMETAEAVMIDGNVVIPAGSPATGEITEVRNKGMWGKSGRINGRVLYVRANGRQIRMSGSIDDKGKTGTAGVVGAAVLIPVAGFFMTGTSADIPLGSPVTAFIDEDVSVAVVPAGAPMVVVAPAANALAPARR